MPILTVNTGYAKSTTDNASPARIVIFTWSLLRARELDFFDFKNFCQKLLKSAHALMRKHSTGNGMPGIYRPPGRKAVFGPTGKETDQISDKRIAELSHDPGNFDIPYQVKNSGIKWDNDFLTDQFRITFADSLHKANKLHGERMTRLTDTKRLHSPEFIVERINEPDCSDEAAFARKRTPVRIAGGRKWERPFNWRKLQLNMSQNDVEAVLGEPSENASMDAQNIYYYGGTNESGNVVFAIETTLEKKVTSWQEPFWPTLQKRLEEVAKNRSMSDIEVSNSDEK